MYKLSTTLLTFINYLVYDNMFNNVHDNMFNNVHDNKYDNNLYNSYH